MSQTNLNAFLGLKSTIVDMTQDTMEENEALSLDDAMAITAVDIIKNKKMQEDVKKRLELQRGMGPLTTYVEGKSIAQFRKEKKGVGRSLPIRQIAIFQSGMKQKESSLHLLKKVESTIVDGTTTTFRNQMRAVLQLTESWHSNINKKIWKLRNP